MKTLELVAYFHRQLGRLDRTRFEDHETACAGELLTAHGEAEIRDLIDYAVREAAKTKFDMLFFNGIKRYVEPWTADRAQAKGRAQRAKAVENCPFCNEAGFLELREEGRGQLVVHPCPHRLELVTQIEEKLRSYRV